MDAYTEAQIKTVNFLMDRLFSATTPVEVAEPRADRIIPLPQPEPECFDSELLAMLASNRAYVEFGKPNTPEHRYVFFDEDAAKWHAGRYKVTRNFALFQDALEWLK